ncbi:MAG: hypothetical protein IPG45_15655 [Deltaproteobacteria bacterium]|nr:hypothetical protein [Deltaproteobacteria bacterium]
MSAAIKNELHLLVDEIPEEEQTTAVRFLRYLRDMKDPVLRTARNAPIDDEPTTAEDLAAMEAGKRDFENGDTISSAELRRELGL